GASGSTRFAAHDPLRTSGAWPECSGERFDAAHLPAGLLTSCSVKARLHAGPVSRRIFSAIRRVVGARRLKWFAPRTARKCALGLAEERAIAWRDSMFPWTVPSNTNVGLLIDASHRPGDRSSSSRGLEVSNGRYSGPYPPASSAG